ncbi:MAG: hypothetical protein NC548_05750 [Lachnospiraceae bacterium]|nr:hypothetical protein [Lachnospiraceae bacterium]
MAFFNGMDTKTHVVGNIDEHSDNDLGFKSEVKGVFESYSGQGVNLIQDLPSVIAAATSKQGFIGAITESMADSVLYSNPAASGDPFYRNYAGRVEQLTDNTLKSIAQESVMTGYAPIVAYNPFFLKKQWIECVFKDVLMTEIPASPVINIGFERRYAIDGEGNRYPLPEAFYDDEITRKLMAEATGTNLIEDPIEIDTLKKLCLIDPTYIPGVIAGDHTVEITHNIMVFQVKAKDSEGTEYTIPTNMTVDVTTHNFVDGKIAYKVMNDDGTVKETIEDELIGRMDFQRGIITLMSTTGAVTHVCLRGKIANRYNQRSLSVERKVEHIQKTMPESGPRLNTAVTIEEAADALALQNIDMIADNISVMGATLANFEDAEINMFLRDSFDAQKRGQANFVQYNELQDNIMITETDFDLLPFDTYAGRLTDWQKDAREWFERTIADIKLKLRTPNIMIAAVANPNTIRFLQDGINWVFSNDTAISGVKLSYQFGIFTSAQDRVHVVTTMRMKEEEGIRFVAIPLTNELITYKHYKYNVTIDRNYRNPTYTLVPNILATQRTLTFEILPVQGVMHINGNSLKSPTTLRRDTTSTNTGVTGGTTGGTEEPENP